MCAVTYTRLDGVHTRTHRATLTVLVSEKGDFKARSVPGNKKGHFLTLRDSVHQRDTTILDCFAHSKATSS